MRFQLIYQDGVGEFHSQPTIPSILPEAAKQQIRQGQLPTLQLSNLFLENGKTCNYTERAIYEKRTVSKKRIRKNIGYSMPGLFKGTRVLVGGGNSEYCSKAYGMEMIL
jgi:hypothetical protein